MGCECHKSIGLDQHEVNNSPCPEKLPISLKQTSANPNRESSDKVTKSDISFNQSMNIITKFGRDSYSEAIFELINKIRANPRKYADTIRDAIKNIVIIKDKFVYKDRVKVALVEGEPAFLEAVNFLEKTHPMDPLQFDNAITIPQPTNEKEAKDFNYFQQHLNTIGKERKLQMHFKELIKIPEVSAMLMIVDDVNKNRGKKRKALLNPDFKNVGISSAEFGKTFVAFFTFSN